jgi:hypothetical protein
MIYGDIVLQNSSIYNLSVESLNADPAFESSDISRIYFNNTSNIYRYNNGTEYIDFSLPNNFMALIDSLGDNWINADFTFNPVPFNDLNTISGLTSNSSLYNVIVQLDAAIHNLAVPSLAELDDVTIPDPIAPGDVLFYDTNGYTFTDINTLIENYSSLGVNNLKDVNIENAQNGGALIYNTSTSQYSILQTAVIIEDYYNETDHTITHDLGVMYVGVQIVNPETNTVITQATITYVDENSFNIVLATAQPILVILTVPYGS